MTPLEYEALVRITSQSRNLSVSAWDKSFHNVLVWAWGKSYGGFDSAIHALNEMISRDYGQPIYYLHRESRCEVLVKLGQVEHKRVFEMVLQRRAGNGAEFKPCDGSELTLTAQQVLGRKWFKVIESLIVEYNAHGFKVQRIGNYNDNMFK